MRNITLNYDLFSPICSSGPGGDPNVKWSEMVLHPLLQMTAWVNCVVLQCQGKKIPNIYDAGAAGQIIYKPDPPNVEQFEAIPSVIRNGGADCEDLCAWRIAELRVRGSPFYPNGEDAQFLVLKFNQPGKPLLYHIQVRRAPNVYFPDPNDPNLVEDPSALLGMPATGYQMLPTLEQRLAAGVL